MEIEIRGRGYQKVIDVLKSAFECVVVDSDKSVDIRETDWYKNMEDSWTPAKELRANRNKLQMTQETLGNKIGKKKQYISDVENGRREITVALAKDLGYVFKIDYRKFL